MPKTKGSFALIGPELAKAKTLRAMGHSYRQIGRELKRSDHTVKKSLATPEAISEVRDEKQELAVLYREKARACVTAIDDEKISKSSALQLATSSGILLDKSLLLGGQPTVNVAVLLEVCEAIRAKDDAESERQFQEAHALLTLPAKST